MSRLLFGEFRFKLAYIIVGFHESVIVRLTRLIALQLANFN